MTVQWVVVHAQPFLLQMVTDDSVITESKAVGKKIGSVSCELEGIFNFVRS